MFEVDLRFIPRILSGIEENIEPSLVQLAKAVKASAKEVLNHLGIEEDVMSVDIVSLDLPATLTSEEDRGIRAKLALDISTFAMNVCLYFSELRGIRQFTPQENAVGKEVEQLILNTKANLEGVLSKGS